MKKKKKIGRPLKYKSPDDMQKKIDAYFTDCDRKEAPYTVTGLALAIDMSRQGLVNYEKKGEFFDTIKKAKGRVEEFLEQRLLSANCSTGVIFNLKNNFGWRDHSDISIGEHRIIEIVRSGKKDNGKTTD